jgi:hypothetical protein
MGVLSCSRSGCGNIMCDIYIPSVGYVCDECKEEFKEYIAMHPIDNEDEIIMALRDFMESTKEIFDKKYSIRIDQFFEKYDKK